MAGVNFEDEEEVKEYLVNLGVEYSYKCHRENDPEGCHLLADYLEGIKKDISGAAKVLQYNCLEKGYDKSCYKLGAYHITGKGGVGKCWKKAYSCFQKVCEGKSQKSVDACHNAALLAQDGRALENGPDSGLALRYFEKACESHFAPSCFNLGVLYIQGSSGLEKNMSLALKFSLKACQLGHPMGCANASRIFKLGEGVEKNDERAEELKNRAKEIFKQLKEAQIKFGE
ncbi:hypothetical protein DNTS_006143 [Danionella cerebrum]|uniref:Cytochrome c oxidase assembly factor 7 n=1 Tax=Danionella cerebrum TaxID=2873325 RepID=A0A553RHJ6_9TELE|nr:hypothetical protein DNTS_006143 [Danionella translucida]